MPCQSLSTFGVNTAQVDQVVWFLLIHRNTWNDGAKWWRKWRELLQWSKNGSHARLGRLGLDSWLNTEMQCKCNTEYMTNMAKFWHALTFFRLTNNSTCSVTPPSCCFQTFSICNPSPGPGTRPACTTTTGNGDFGRSKCNISGSASNHCQSSSWPRCNGATAVWIHSMNIQVQHVDVQDHHWSRCPCMFPILFTTLFGRPSILPSKSIYLVLEVFHGCSIALFDFLLWVWKRCTTPSPTQEIVFMISLDLGYKKSTVECPTIGMGQENQWCVLCLRDHWSGL